MKARWSIRAQLYVLELVVAVPLLCLLAHNIYVDAKNDMQQARGKALGLAQITANMVRDYLEDSEHLLTRLSERRLVRALNASECEYTLASALDLLHDVTNFVIVNLTGDVVCSVLPQAKLTNFREADWLLRTLREDKFVINGPSVDPATGKWVSMQAYPLHDDQGRPIGIVGLSIDLASYEQAIGSAAMPPGTEYGIIDQNGLFVTHFPDPKKWVGKTAREAQWAKIALSSKDGQWQASGDDGVEKVYGFSTVPGSNWIAFASISADVVFAPAQRTVIHSSIFALVVALAVAVVAWMLSRRITRPIRDIAEAANAVAGGQIETRVRVQGPYEIEEVATQFNRMLDAREHAEGALRETTRRLHGLSHRLLNIQESERRHIARELHDELGQALTFVKLRLQVIQRLPAGASGSSHLDECIRITERSLEQVRDLSRELRPLLLDDLGLMTALRSHLDQQAQAAGLVAHFNAAPFPARLGADLEIVCFRVVQEAVTNVVRHAHAHHLWVELTLAGDELDVRVRDDGIGFDSSAARARARTGTSMGLLSMEERAMLAGGRVEFTSTPKQGTEVRAVFPLTFAAERSDEEVSQ